MSSKFQRVMKSILRGIENTEVHIDNIIVFTNDIEIHRKTLIDVIKRLTKYYLTIKKEKCKLFMTEIRLLGHQITTAGIHIDPKKYDCLKNIKTPATGKQLESVLGLTNYFRSFLPNYARIAAPLERIRKESTLTWTSECQEALDTLITGIQNAGILHHPNFEREFYLATDASYDGLGAVLFQKDITNTKKELIIDCASRALSPSEKNYSVTKLELCGLVFALNKYRQFLLMRPFVCYTDHSALTSLFKAKFNNSILTNTWFDTILDFIDVMTIEHRPGISNVLPDLLSRTYKKEFKVIAIVSQENSQSTEDDDIVILLDDHDTGNTSIIDNNNTQNNNSESTILPLADDVERIIITDPERQCEIIKDVHAFGHFSAGQMIAKIRSLGYDWPKIREQVVAFIHTCHTCQKYKLQRQGFHPLKHHSAKLPFEWLVMDLFGPLHITPSGNRFVLVIVDVASRYCWLRSVEDKSATAVARELIKLFSEYGVCKVISSDNDGAFLNTIITEMKQQWKFDQRSTTPYYPRANGMAERHVRIAKQVLKRTIDAATEQVKENEDKFENWDQYIPAVQYYSAGKNCSAFVFQ